MYVIVNIINCLIYYLNTFSLIYVLKSLLIQNNIYFPYFT